MLQGSPHGEMVEEKGRLLRGKVKRLAALVRAGKYVVMYSGAGISTAAGAPDFRGPSGVWTLQAKGQSRTALRFVILLKAIHLQVEVSLSCVILHKALDVHLFPRWVRSQSLVNDLHISYFHHSPTDVILIPDYGFCP